MGSCAKWYGVDWTVTSFGNRDGGIFIVHVNMIEGGSILYCSLSLGRVNWGNLIDPSTKFSFHKNPRWTPGWGSLLLYNGEEGFWRVGLVYTGSRTAEGEVGGVALSSALARNVCMSSVTRLGVGE
jgi:hypothetical protein